MFFFLLLARITRSYPAWLKALSSRLQAPVVFGRHPSRVPGNSWILFPLTLNTFGCGICGIVSFKKPDGAPASIDLKSMEQVVGQIQACGVDACLNNNDRMETECLGGREVLASLQQLVDQCKEPDCFRNLFYQPDSRLQLEGIVRQLNAILGSETRIFDLRIGELAFRHVEILQSRMEWIRDITWRLETEILGHMGSLERLIGPKPPIDPAGFQIFRQIDAVLRSIDRLEVRGRDSAGISLMFQMAPEVFETFGQNLSARGLDQEWNERLNPAVLSGRDIGQYQSGQNPVSVSFTCKVAAEIGSLGQNVAAIRKQIREDQIFHLFLHYPHLCCTISSHTRWASVGAITLPNCHPVDNATLDSSGGDAGLIHACLNGDIDNYRELSTFLEAGGYRIPPEITTDTKIIPLLVHYFLKQGMTVETAFRNAVNRFEGSHAIILHTDRAPGKLFLAQKGSGQALFVGLASTHYMPASEVYGFIEETSRFLKLEGEKFHETPSGKTQGQIFILNQHSSGNLSGIQAMYYDGTPISLDDSMVKTTEITSRDIDRQHYPHYFLKEISESPSSVEKTLINRWRVRDEDQLPGVDLTESMFPARLQSAFLERKIHRIWLIGQGTAGVAAQACADILTEYLSAPYLQISAMKSSELSGFRMPEESETTDMSDALVIAISQSGTTADTNRAVDMVRGRGAWTLAIVNRRDSDLTFKVDGVMYTSSGRDIEMSVASTKAFYGQIVAGALLGLFLADRLKKRSRKWIASEIQNLLNLPGQMRAVLNLQESIRQSARRLALSRLYWAVVGSGNNKAAADEIRIKLSELCYKTISSDYVEDKKHIDLSSEPLILVCAAGSRQHVIGDIVKDTAIFKAHKAAVIVIADEGETRFADYADDVFHIPALPPHLSPILNTLVGHIWGYHAALTIHGCSRFLFDFREDLLRFIEDGVQSGMDVYEIVLEKSFREKMATFYHQLRRRKIEHRFCTEIGGNGVADLPLLLKYLSGRLPVSDFEMDFNRKGTARNMLDTLLESLGNGINLMARPIDAIKHQAKTVTVGTSRLRERLEGVLFDALASFGFSPANLTHMNVQVLKNLQGIISHIEGGILYRIHGLNVLGEPVDTTTIEVVQKSGTLQHLPSRVETDPRLKGSKRIIAREGNVFIGRGLKDGRSMIIIPILSGSAPVVMSHQLLLHIAFHQQVPLETRMLALGGKLERIRNIVQENSVAWKDVYLNRVRMEDLFGQSAEKTGEFIVSGINGRE